MCNSHAFAGIVATVVLWAVTGCDGQAYQGTRGAPQSSADLAPLRNPELQAGPGIRVATVRSPYEGDAGATAEGKRLYNWMNCSGCHGGQGGGGIGPPLADDDWIYGGDPASLYQTIVQGRPYGMPAFGGRLPDDEIWKIVAFVRTLGKGQGEGGGVDR